MIVEHVDEPGKAPCRVAHLGGKPGDAGDDDDREAPGKLQIVALGPRAFAKRREVEPHEAPGARPRPKRTRFDREQRILVEPGAHPFEPLSELAIDRFGERRAVHVRMLELAQTVRQRRVEGIHEEALSATDPAPEVDPARWYWNLKPAQQRAAGAPESQELVVELLQSKKRALLGRIENDAPARELRPEVP